MHTTSSEVSQCFRPAINHPANSIQSATTHSCLQSQSRGPDALRLSRSHNCNLYKLWNPEMIKQKMWSLPWITAAFFPPFSPFHYLSIISNNVAWHNLFYVGCLQSLTHAHAHTPSFHLQIPQKVLIWPHTNQSHLSHSWYFCKTLFGCH